VEPSLGDEREILHQVTHGLTYLHALEIVHLDIKPTNILIFEPQVVTLLKPHIKLADFGLCKFSKTDKSDFTNSHRTNPQGTLGWMAPELYKSERYDSKVDLFPLGCIFGYTLSEGGKHPFGVEPAKRQNRIKQKPMLLKIEDLKQPYRDHPIGYQLIQRMVQKDPEDRPTALEVLNSDFFLLPSKNEKFDSVIYNKLDYNNWVI